MHIHNIHTRILFSAFFLASFLDRRMSHVACRISLIALLLRNLQLNETTCYEINYEVCNSTKQRIYYEICNSTEQRIYYEICNSTRQRVTKSITRFAIQRDSVLRDQRDNVIKF